MPQSARTTIAFPPLADEDTGILRLEDTDRPLPKRISQSTRYAYFKTIARGGKCIVQSCRDLHLGRTVCYKKLKPELADDPIEQRRFLREARVSAKLQHPNTVPTYELSRDRHGHYFFTMKLVHGYTLREVLDYRARYDLTQLIDVLVQIAHTLEYAHAHRVIHRDIKPENILVGPFGEVLLLDWGLAKVWGDEPENEDRTADADDDPNRPVSSMTHHGKLQGTVAYMSPEQIRRSPDIDNRTDIFSLGVVLYEILTGRTPALADTVSEMTDRIQNDKPPRPSKVARDPVPELLETLAMRCLAKEPGERTPSCAEMIRLLQEDW